MSKHTPGSWYVYTAEDGDAIAVAQHGVGPKGGWMGIQVARMPVPNEYKTREQINANARLIAAAPELLEALKAIIDTSQASPSEWVRACSKAAAAIAKAEGRT